MKYLSFFNDLISTFPNVEGFEKNINEVIELIRTEVDDKNEPPTIELMLKIKVCLKFISDIKAKLETETESLKEPVKREKKN